MIDFHSSVCFGIHFFPKFIKLSEDVPNGILTEFEILIHCSNNFKLIVIAFEKISFFKDFIYKLSFLWKTGYLVRSRNCWSWSGLLITFSPSAFARCGAIFVIGPESNMFILGFVPQKMPHFSTLLNVNYFDEFKFVSHKSETTKCKLVTYTFKSLIRFDDWMHW